MSKTFPQLISASYQRYLDGFQAACLDSAVGPSWLAQRLADFPHYSLFAEHLQLVWGSSDFVGSTVRPLPNYFRSLSTVAIYCVVIREMIFSRGSNNGYRSLAVKSN